MMSTVDVSIGILLKQGVNQYSADQTFLEVVEAEDRFRNLLTSPCAVMLP